MLSEKVAELERRLLLVEREFAQERLQNQLMHRKYGRRDMVSKFVILVCLIIITMMGTFTLRDTKQSVVTAAQRAVTVLDAPLLVRGAKGNTIVEISEDKGHYGLTVNGPNGRALFLGSQKDTDAGQVYFIEKEKVRGRITGSTFFSYNSAGKVVASIGAKDGGSGFMSLGNANGDSIVEAGMTQEGRGIVRAYPLGGPPPMVIPTTIQGGKGN